MADLSTADAENLLAALPEPSGIALDILSLSHQIQVRHDAAFKARVGITVRQFGALTELERNPGIGSGQLARFLMITPQSAGPLLTRLETMGLVRRDRNQGMRMQVHLTEKARKLVELGSVVIAEQLDLDRRRLPPEEHEELARLLAKFRTSLSA